MSHSPVIEYVYRNKYPGNHYKLYKGRRYEKYEYVGEFSNLNELHTILNSKDYPLYCNYFKVLDSKGKKVFELCGDMAMELNEELVISYYY